VRKSLLKRLAIRLGCQNQKTTAKSLVIPKLLWAVAGLALSMSVHAVGMGGINVASALGQPLKAEIELMIVSKTEKDSLVARLASPEAYKGAGLEYPYGNKLKFEIQSRASGEPYIKVSSAQPINDPFVSLLVELSWSAGKLSREYTFLLDPVGYVPVQPAQRSVEAVAPAVQTAPSVVPGVPAETEAAPVEQAPPLTAAITPVEPAPAGQPTPAEQEAPASAVPAVAAETAIPVKQAEPEVTEAKPVEQAASAAAVEPENQEFLAVRRGDTLYKIAAQTKLADMSLERMLVALYRANADQFDGKNMNRIRVGKILRLPSQDQYESVTQYESVKEIHAQAADWNAYRQKLASAAAVSSQSQAAQQIASGKITSSVTDKAPVAKESSREVLKLSKGEAPGDRTATGAGGKSMSAQDKKSAAQEDAIAKAKAVKEGQERAAILEKNIQDMKRLAQLKSEAAVLAQQPSAAAPAVAPAPAKPAEASAAKPKPTEVKPEPSLLDQILGEPLYLEAAGAALLVLVGLAFVLYRRKKKHYDVEIEEAGEDIGSASGSFKVPVTPSPDTGDFTRSNVTQAAATSESDNVDPISEAELFLNFGRDVQAEDILKEALQNTPNNHQIHLKLLGIYANRKDADSFSTIARKLQDSGDEDAWQQAVAMGRKLEPGNPMYGGGGFRSMEDTGSATMQVKSFDAMPQQQETSTAQASGLDFDFGAPAGQTAPSPEQDFLGAGEDTLIMPDTEQEAVMDFDITSTNPALPEAEESMTAARSEANKPADDGGMAFTLDFPIEDVVKPASSPSAAGMGFEGISLNFDDAAAPPSESAAGGQDDQWQEVATKLDLAKAYQEMGDNDGAREILEEVMREGDAGQREAAQTLFGQLLG